MLASPATITSRAGSRTLLAALVLAFGLYACGGGDAGVRPKVDGPPAKPRDVSRVPDAIPKQEPKSRYGNPSSYVVFGKRYYVMDSSLGYVERGIASWYGNKFHGRRTSSGVSYDMYAMTAAHKTLPLPTYVQVTNLENGRSVVVKVNDRGPFHDNRIIDMSYAAAQKLGMLAKGTALVEVRAINPGEDAGPKLRRARHMDSEISGTDGRFYIQVGAFSSLDNAERLRMRLDDLETKLARIYQTVVDNKTLYRVRIGPLQDVETADRIVTRLPEYGIHDHDIVIE